MCVADWNAWQQPHFLCCSSWQDCPCHGGITVLHLLARDLAEASWPGAREAPSAGSSMVLVVAGHGSRPAVHLCGQQRALAACGKGIASREWSDVHVGWPPRGRLRAHQLRMVTQCTRLGPAAARMAAGLAVVSGRNLDSVVDASSASRTFRSRRHERCPLVPAAALKVSKCSRYGSRKCPQVRQGSFSLLLMSSAGPAKRVRV